MNAKIVAQLQLEILMKGTSVKCDQTTGTVLNQNNIKLNSSKCYVE